jgi:K+-transporting ATPase ATPase A chain
MSGQSLLQYLLFLAIVIACARPLGLYLFRVFTGGRTWLDPVLSPLERGLYRLAGVDPAVEMDWMRYALSFALFGVLGTLLLLVILIEQQALPWFFGGYQTTPMTLDLAINTAISFATTTTWQAYGGETTMSYFSQMTGLAAQNFLAGAGGLAVGIAFIRGFARSESGKLGNFWVDVTRATLWVLLPLSLIGGLLLVWQGVPMNVDPYTHATTLEGGSQVIAQGPVAALETIKNLGTNGGGFFNVNAAHPFENPTPLTNLLEALMIVLLPAALAITFGEMVGRPRQGWLIFWVMTGLFAAGLAIAAAAEQAPPQAAASLAVDAQTTSIQSGGNMEGKETRFGVHGSVLAAIATSNGATGSYNSMHDSYSPVGGLVPLSNMLLGEIIYGGLGSGIYSMVMMILITVFIGGLMVGHTPMFLGKSLTSREMRLVGLYAIAGSAIILILTGIAVVTPGGLAGLTTNKGAHGFSEILYAYTSAFANNGQNFAGLSANTPFYNYTISLAMLAGRFGLATLALALAGSVAAQKTRPVGQGHLPTDTGTFALLLVGTIFIVAGLSYLPAVALGPLAERFAQ